MSESKIILRCLPVAEVVVAVEAGDEKLKRPPDVVVAVEPNPVPKLKLVPCKSQNNILSGLC